MQNLAQLGFLREQIYNNLDTLIDSDYYHLDFPNYPNIGDSLIWAGELAYLSRLPFKCHYACSIAYFDKSKIKNKDLILLQGGGNFGDLWRDLQDFRLMIIQKYHNNKIIIFPQTVYYTDSELLKKDAAILDNHPNLTICVRDVVSLKLLQSVLKYVNLILLPDMAFCLDLSYALKSSKPSPKTNLLLKRRDKELLNQNYLSKIAYSEKLDISDWTTFENQKDFMKFRIQNFLAKNLFKIPLLKQYLNSKSGFHNDEKQLKHFIKAGIVFINNYDEIYTTRLHGFILAVLLNKKVYLFDNSYGKNRNFYQTWMQNFKNVSFIS